MDVMEDMEETALFELHGQDGHVWKIYEDGRTEGFPDGTMVLNRATPLLNKLRSQVVSNAGRRRTDVKKPAGFR